MSQQQTGFQPIASTVVVPHHSAWAEVFCQESARIASVFGALLVAIHHAGSTAIPGIKAKPIIDILVEVQQIEAVDAYNDAIIDLGYEPRGEYEIPGRRFFTKTSGTTRTHNVHTFQSGHPEIERMLNLRDYLRAHPNEAQAYSRLKEDLSRQFPTDIERYTLGKSEFIEEIARRATLWRAGVSKH
jgi:GrpB-like predicted nucleotidyltransferase (UPF0157 family)